jgi:large subunit ribosomal protein L7/L12
MTPKEIAKAIDGLSLEDARKLVEELKLLGYVAPTVAVAAVEEVKEDVKSTFNVILNDSGPKKMDVIKYWKNSNSDITLMQAKAVIDTVPVTLRENISEVEAKALKTELEELGASVTIS